MFDFKFKALKYLPFGRVNEYLAKLTDNQKQRTARKGGMSIGDNDALKTWPTREAMARAIRKEERDAPHSYWIPVVPLGHSEGY